MQLACAHGKNMLCSELKTKNTLQGNGRIKWKKVTKLDKTKGRDGTYRYMDIDKCYQHVQR